MYIYIYTCVYIYFNVKGIVNTIIFFLRHFVSYLYVYIFYSYTYIYIRISCYCFDSMFFFFLASTLWSKSINNNLYIEKNFKPTKSPLKQYIKKILATRIFSFITYTKIYKLNQINFYSYGCNKYPSTAINIH